LELVERTLDDAWRQTYVMQERLFAIKSQFQNVEVVLSLFKPKRLLFVP
jgi:hypothetical protein